MISLATICSQSYYSIIGHIPYAVYYIPVAYLFYNGTFVPLNPLYLILPIPHPLSLWQPHISSL